MRVVGVLGSSDMKKHKLTSTADLRHEHRSMKAGASTPATQGQLGSSDDQHPRSTKAGASTPATLLNSAKGQYRDKPSLVHRCGSLAADVFAAISSDFGRYPVRMVRSSSRDCLNRKSSRIGWPGTTTQNTVVWAGAGDRRTAGNEFGLRNPRYDSARLPETAPAVHGHLVRGKGSNQGTCKRACYQVM